MVDDIIPEDNIHFLMIDSDIPEMEQTIEDSKEHVGFNALEVLSIYRPNIENILADGIKKNPVHPNLANWMDADFPDVTVTKDGAHGNRQIGRLMFSNAYEDIRMLLFDRLEEIHDKANGNWMDVIIVSSLSGGTGSGILSDLTYNIRAYGKAKVGESSNRRLPVDAGCYIWQQERNGRSGVNVPDDGKWLCCVKRSRLLYEAFRKG